MSITREEIQEMITAAKQEVREEMKTQIEKNNERQWKENMRNRR